MSKTLSSLAIVSFFFWSCDSDDDLKGKIFDYKIVNTSKIEVGIKVIVTLTDPAFTLVEESIILAPGEERTVLKSSEQREPSSFIHSAEVYDKTFKEKYKVVNLGERTIDGNIVRINVWMPHPNSKEVIKNNTGVFFYLDENSIFGYYPQSDLTHDNYFFTTSTEFESISKIHLPPSTFYFNTIRVFDNTIIAQDVNVYAENTSFIISTNKGTSWTPFLSIFNRPDSDFLTADFINPNQGWLFTYNNWDSTKVFKVSSGTYNRISSLKGFCVTGSKFVDPNKGYVVANTNDNVSPASSQNSYFFKTEDGGKTWMGPTLISSTESPGKLFIFPSGKIILMRGNSFGMHKSYFSSEDDGQSWKLIQAQIEGLIRDMYFVSAEIGFIKTGNNSLWSKSNEGFLYKTTDGGKNWVKIPSPTLLGSTVYFYNEQLGYLQDLIYGKGQVLLVTKDGGITWKEVLYPYSYLTE